MTSSRTCETVVVEAGSGSGRTSDASSRDGATAAGSSSAARMLLGRFTQDGGSVGGTGGSGTGTRDFSDLPEDLRARIPARCNPVPTTATLAEREQCASVI